MCFHEDLTTNIFKIYGDNFIGFENLFASHLEHIDDPLNFEIETLTMTLLVIRNEINQNIAKFRCDFQIKNLYRIRDNGMKKIYVIISTLKPYWLVSSIGPFIGASKKMRLFDEVENGFFLWARLKII